MSTLNTLPLGELYTELSASGLIRRLLELARDEDLGSDWELGDVTSRAFVPGYVRGKARVAFRSGGVAAGLACIDELVMLFKADVDVKWHAKDGDMIAPKGVAAEIVGDMRAILRIERTLLNLLGRMSGIATRTREFVKRAAQGGRAGVFDTRKTTPGMRMLEKYAVRCGGGMLHRLGLYDAVMMKDNHVAAVAALPGSGTEGRFAAEVSAAVRKARMDAPKAGLRFIELEVDRLEQLRDVLSAGGCGVDIVLLDNMSVEQLNAAVKMRNESGVRMALEASGGITLETIAAVAATGVERISTGSLTHGATWLDVGLDVE